MDLDDGFGEYLWLNQSLLSCWFLHLLSSCMSSKQSLLTHCFSVWRQSVCLRPIAPQLKHLNVGDRRLSALLILSLHTTSRFLLLHADHRLSINIIQIRCFYNFRPLQLVNLLYMRRTRIFQVLTECINSIFFKKYWFIVSPDYYLQFTSSLT